MSGHDIVLPTWARLEVYFYRMMRALPASNHDEAMQLMAETLNGVEDEFSGVSYDPSESGNDGRMYPPAPRFLARRASAPGVRVYRQRGHVTYVADNGAIETRVVQAEAEGPVEYTVLDKPGRDGRRVSDHEVDS
jgi:hypothetical protein